MKHMFKIILALALGLMLAIPVFALADGDVPAEENRAEERIENPEEAQDGEQEEPDEDVAIEADFVGETPEETGEEAPGEVEADLPEWDEEEIEEESSDEEEDKEVVEEENTDEESTDEESAEEESVEEESTDEEPTEEPAEEQPTANALVYNGEPQALAEAIDGWLFSLDGVAYGVEPPTAIDAGAYTVYCVPAGDAEAAPVALTVTIEKADVVLTPPVANVF